MEQSHVHLNGDLTPPAIMGGSFLHEAAGAFRSSQAGFPWNSRHRDGDGMFNIVAVPIPS